MHGDDVWGSDSEGEHGRHESSSELEHEWQARQSQFHTLGYRDGVDEGKASSVQEGFNSGYAEGTVAGFNWGVTRGLTSAFISLPASVKEQLIGDVGARNRLEALESSIHGYSSTDALRSFYRDLSSAESEEIGTRGLEEPLDGVVSMVGLDRVPDAHSAGVWEAETEQATVPVESLRVLESREDESSSSFTGSAAGKSELEELEMKVRRELEAQATAREQA